ncbi:hypothetical protein LTR64_001136 [Lithohypha guttulata]|uniref:uncharacterized protein n=1 Tax=Lithohypha guttulata TaxID=1690604 RepID=UPI002DE1234C|nr:hypothetical protein LTR51_003330 [Lithohypha guttulata]
MDNNVTSAGQSNQAINDNHRCSQCKKDHAKCVDHETDWRCRLCVKKGRSCSARIRAGSETTSSGNGSEFTATIFAILGLLNLCQLQCDKIYSIIYPFPCVNPFDLTSAFLSQSWALSSSLRSVASAIRIQNSVFGFISQHVLMSQYAIWTGVFFRQLHQNLAYHPHRSAEAISTANAADIYSCVRHILNPSQGANFPYQPHQSSLHQRIERYRKTEWNVNHFLQSRYIGVALASVAQLSAVVQLKSSFPACHIAYWNGDKQAAVELWKQTSCDIDILGRTFAHVVAEAGDLKMMQEIYAICPRALRYAGADLRGLTVFALTIARGSPECCNFMLEIRPDVPSVTEAGPRLLDLALASGNKEIVDRLIEFNFASPPFTQNMVKAIELGRADLGSSFLQWLNRAPYASQLEIQNLARLAATVAEELGQRAEFAQGQGWHGSETDLRTRHGMMVGLWCDLQNIRVVPAVVQDATRSLTTMQIPDDDGLL